MVKECPVVLNNDAVTVIRYDGNEVQFPSIQKETRYVYVKYADGKYFIVDDETKTANAAQIKKKNSTDKKTTVDKNIENVKNDIVSEDK